MNQPRTLQQWFNALDHFGERPAVIALGKSTMQQHAYEQIERLGSLFATGMKKRELSPGAHIAFLAPNSFPWLAACIGVVKAGMVPVPIDVQFDNEALVHVLKDSQPRLIVTDKKNAARLQKLKSFAGIDMVLLDGTDNDENSWRNILADEPDSLPRVEPDDEAVLFYTSGTTGTPKGVPLTHQNIATQLAVLQNADLVTDQDRVLLPLPLHHVYPFVVGMLAPLARGLPIVLPYSLTGPQMVRALNEGNITIVMGVPRLYRALYDGIMARAESSGRMASAIFHGMMGLSSWLRRWLGVRAGKWLLSPLHRQFGRHLRVLACGGSPLDDELA